MAETTEPTESAITDTGHDVIAELAGIAVDSPLGQLRAQQPAAVRAAQGSYQALLEPDDLPGVSPRERYAIALRVAVLTPSEPVAAWHRERLRALGLNDEALAAIEEFPAGPALAPRETAILAHTDLLTIHPGAATPAHLAALQAAGLSPRDIVTISQLVAFVSYQVRVLAGLRLLAEEA
ncbi:MAG: CMD domain protein [Thermomicrobiales bacterium]